MAEQNTTIAADLVSYVQAILKDKTNTTATSTVNDAVALVLSKSDALLAVEGFDTDVEGCFKLLLKATGVTHTQALIKSLTSNHNNATLKLRILAEVFNNTPVVEASLRFQVLHQIIQYAGATKNVSLVESYFKTIDTLVVGVAPSDLKKLYLTIAHLLEQNDTQGSLSFLEKYLTLFQASDANEAKEAAIRAAVLFIKSPVQSFVSHIHLIHLPAIQALQGKDKIYDLLDIVSNKTLTEYLAFEKSSGSVLKEHGIDAEATTSSMRLLTLCSFPTGHDEITFDDIVAKLQVAEEDVEKWVVRAITANLIQAKINQLGRSVVISRSLQRGFDLSDWKELQATLLRYKSNVGSLLETIRRAQVANAVRTMTKAHGTHHPHHHPGGKRHGHEVIEPEVPSKSAKFRAAWQQTQDADDLASSTVDYILHAVVSTIDEKRLANNTIEYISRKLINGLLYMTSMVTIELTTKFKDDPATYEPGEMPPQGIPDIWSKHFIKAKKKPKCRVSNSRDDRRLSLSRSPSRSTIRGRSPDRNHSIDFSHDDEMTMSIRDLAFHKISIDIHIPTEERIRRETIEKLLEERERVEKLRVDADAKRHRTVARLVIEPLESKKKSNLTKEPDEKGNIGSPEEDEAQEPTYEEQKGASEVILVEESEMYVGEDSHLISRRSKSELLKTLPSPMLEPTVVLPPSVSTVQKDTARVLISRGGASRGSSRKSNRCKTPNAKTSGARSFLASLLFHDDKDSIFMQNDASNGGPCFQEDSSPAKGVVIKQGQIVRFGEPWEIPKQRIPRSISEPALQGNKPTTPTQQGNSSLHPPDIPEDNELAMNSHDILTLNHIELDHHRHGHSKSVNLRIRTPACRKRRSRKVIDGQNDGDGHNTASRAPLESPSDRSRRPSTSMVVEPHKIVRSPIKHVKLPSVQSRLTNSSSNVTIQNPLLSLPLIKPS